MRITVFTPTYNRGYIIRNLYDSLKRQSFKDFEWVVIDDGSTDDTEELFKEFIDTEFPILYKKVSNGGKHRAINKGVSMATGELFFIVDSDDYLTDDALEIIDRVEKTIPQAEKDHFGGICGQKGYSQKESVGNTGGFDGFLDITMLERTKHHISGDKAEVFYTSILEKYPFPEFENEIFVTECVVWDRIAADGYKLRFFNNIIYICDYLPDGLTAKGNELFLKNPKGHGLYLYQMGIHGKLYGVAKWNEYLRYYYNHRGKLPFGEIARNLHMNPVCFFFRLTGMKIFYKLYDR